MRIMEYASRAIAIHTAMFTKLRCLFFKCKFNYKLLNMILNCNSFLHQLKLRPNKCCYYCPDTAENIELLVFECDNVKVKWSKLCTIMQIDINVERYSFRFLIVWYNIWIIQLMLLIELTNLKCYVDLKRKMRHLKVWEST